MKSLLYSFGRQLVRQFSYYIIIGLLLTYKLNLTWNKILTSSHLCGYLSLIFKNNPWSSKIRNLYIEIVICRSKWIWCFDDDHDDLMQMMQMGFSSLNSKQWFKNTSHNIKMITSILGREFLFDIAKGLAK